MMPGAGPAYWALAIVVVLCTLPSVGYAVGEVRRPDAAERDNATYLVIRSIALTAVAVVPLLVTLPAWLVAVSALVLLVQSGDLVFGLRRHHRVVALGAGVMVALVGACLAVFLAAEGFLP